MKHTFLYLFPLVLFMACGAPENTDDLEQLRAQRAELDARIAEIEKQQQSTDTSASRVLEVTAVPVIPQPFSTYIEVQGRVDAEENVSLSTEIPGTITRIFVKAGDPVKKGQVLAETDARAQQQQLNTVQTQYNLARQVFEKQKNLWDQKIGTEIAFLQAKANMESAEAGVNAIQEQIRMTRIISPIDGTVDNVNIKIGQMVSPGMPAINVINFSNLTVKADLAESYSGRVKTGNEALVVFPDIDDSLRSRVKYASRAINQLSRTFQVEVALDNKKEYHPNMVAKLRINDYQSPKPVVVVPLKYVQRGLREQYVFVAANGVVEKRNIRTGREYSGMAEVLEGLREGDRLITEGFDLVDEGDRVRLRG